MIEIDQLERGFGFLVHDIARQITSVLDERLKPYGLTRSHWRAVLYIWRSPGISQTELSEILDLSRMGVTGLVDRMESKGLVCRKDDQTDRRVKRVYLTDPTAELVPVIITLGRETIDDFFEGIDAAELDLLTSLLLKVKQNGCRLLSDKLSDKSDKK